MLSIISGSWIKKHLVNKIWWAKLCDAKEKKELNYLAMGKKGLPIWTCEAFHEPRNETEIQQQVPIKIIIKKTG